MSRRLHVAVVVSVCLCAAPAAGQEKYPSPTIEALRLQLAGGDEILEEFWRQVTLAGTPLVEPFESDTRYSLVTFVWRGTSATRNVAVVGTVMKRPIELMARLGDTEIWYATAKVPVGARFAYWLSVNSPMVTEGPRLPEQLATLQADPLNPHRWNCGPAGGLFQCQSKVELSGAVPQPWIAQKPDTPKGKLEKYRLKSDLLQNERNLSIYTPSEYQRNRRPYALLLVFDEDAYLDTIPTPVILDNLIAASRIPPTVAVLIGNPNPETRNRELPPNPQFAAFLATELVPWIRARYNVTRDPRSTVVAGSSYGGLAATYAALRHPDVFGNVLCQSGDFTWAPDHVHAMGKMADATTETGWLAKEFINSRKLPLKFYLDAGVFEIDQLGTGGHILETSRHMRDVLLAKGYEVHYQQFVGGHDYLSWRGTLADGLIALLRLGP